MGRQKEIEALIRHITNREIVHIYGSEGTGKSGGWLWDHVSPSATFYFGSITAGLSATLFIIYISVFIRHRSS